MRSCLGISTMNYLLVIQVKGSDGENDVAFLLLLFYVQPGRFLFKDEKITADEAIFLQPCDDVRVRNVGFNFNTYKSEDLPN